MTTAAEQVEKRFSVKNPASWSELDRFHKRVAELHAELFLARFGHKYDWTHNDTKAVDEYCSMCGKGGWAEEEILFLVRARLESDNAQAEGPWLWFSQANKYLSGPLALDGYPKSMHARQAADFARQSAEVDADRAQRDADRKASDTEGRLQDAIAKVARDLQLRKYEVFKPVSHLTTCHLLATRGTSVGRKSAALRIVVKIGGDEHATDREAFVASVRESHDDLTGRDFIDVSYDPTLEG